MFNIVGAILEVGKGGVLAKRVCQGSGSDDTHPAGPQTEDRVACPLPLLLAMSGEAEAAALGGRRAHLRDRRLPPPSSAVARATAPQSRTGFPHRLQEM